MDERFFLLSLQYVNGLGNSTIKKLLKIFGNAHAIFEKEAPLIAKNKGWNFSVPFPKITKEITALVEKDIQYLDQHDIQISSVLDANFPKRLLNCKDSPYFFYYKGNGDFNRNKMIAIVGTREATSYGKDAVRKLLTDLQYKDVSVVSGLALGIDTVAHEQALENGLHTIAVLGSGLGIIYPPANQKLAERILDNGGTIISEFPFKTSPDRQNFPQRNRIIAGMVDAVVVAESGLKGGSIITAYIAHSYNRDVFAIPGSIFSHTSDGCHQLIRKNMAAIVTSGDSLLELMNWDIQSPTVIQTQLFVELSDEENLVVEVIKNNGQPSIDDIVAACPSLKPSRISSLLLGLELNGVLEALPGKVYRLFQRR